MVSEFKVDITKWIMYKIVIEITESLIKYICAKQNHKTHE